MTCISSVWLYIIRYMYSIPLHPVIDTYIHLFGVFSFYIMYARNKRITVILSYNSYLKEILRELTKFASITRVVKKIHGSVLGGVMSSRDSPMLYLCGERVIPSLGDAHTCTYSRSERGDRASTLAFNKAKPES